MRTVWTALWALVASIIGSAMPVANGITHYAQAFESTGRITNKAVANFEASVDLDAVAAQLALRKAKEAAQS